MVYLLSEDRPEAVLALEDMVRDSAGKAVRELQEMGLRVMMLTGDSEAVAKTVADQLHLDDYLAQILPDQKSDQIKQLRQNNKGVAMVGDGVQNLWWAAGYNAIAIPLAAGILYPIYQFLLPPAAGAVVMSLSTVIVAVNAKLLSTA